MLDFFRQNQIVLTSVFCLLVSLFILTAASTGRLRSDPAGPFLLESMRPLQRAFQAVVLGLRKVQNGYRTLKGLWRENQTLERRILQLEAERNNLLEAAATNRRLRELLDLKSGLGRKSVAAAVIGKSASTWFQSLTVPMGVVGQVVGVSPRSAKVLLITDHNSGVDVIVQRSRARGIVSGSLENGPVMKYVGRNEDIREGDRLITSGLGGIYPRGLLVGTIGEMRKNGQGLFLHVEIELAVNPSRIEEVLLVSVNPAELEN
jgi:rod shape-determining protein MreC